MAQYVDYQIWQMKKGDELHYCRFENYETAKKAKPELNLSNYELVYDDDIRVDDGLSDIQILDLLYAKFNEGSQIPMDFEGHSLSVSDLVNIEGNYYYIQDIGFKKLDESFLDDLTLAKMYINEYCSVEYKGHKPEPFKDYADFDILERVPLAYTTLTDEELEINTYANLKSYSIYQEFDGEIFILGKYDSLKEMNENYLKGLNFDDLIFVDYKVQDRHAKAEKQARSERLEALAKLNLSTPRYDLPFLTGSALLSHSFDFQDESWEYIGGLDMEGHERKDNFDKRESHLSVSSSVSGYITVYTSGTGEWYDNEYQFFDPTKADDINSLKITLDRFIANSEVLSVWKDPVNREGERELVSDNDIVERKVSKREKTFREQLEDYREGKFSRYDDFKVCDTPAILLAAGCEQYPMLYTKTHLKKATLEKDERKHTHGLSYDFMERVPEMFSSPVMVMDSLTRNDSVLIVLSSKEFDPDFNPIIASVTPNGKGTYDMQIIESNFITSIYGRNNFPNFINSCISNDKVLFYDKTKSQELFSVLGLQFPEGLNNLDSNSIIHQSRNIVKPLEPKNEEKFEYTNEGLYEQLGANYNSFIDDMKRQSVSKAIEKSYEITWKRDIYYYFENCDVELSDAQIRPLMSSPNPLDEIYQTIEGSEVYNAFSDIGDAIEDTANQLKEAYLREHGSNSLTMLSAYWSEPDNAYRIYDPEKPHITIAYDDHSLGDIEKRVKDKGYLGLIKPDEPGTDKSEDVKKKLNDLNKGKHH